jgi:hypothetical protein
MYQKPDQLRQGLPVSRVRSAPARANRNSVTQAQPYLIVKVTLLDTMFVDESNTVTVALQGLAISAAGTAALSWVALTNVVVSALLRQRTTDVESKPPPLTLSVKAGPPWLALDGEMEVTSTMDSTVEIFRSHTLRPCVAARSVFEAECKAKPSTATWGSPTFRVAQVTPTLVV